MFKASKVRIGNKLVGGDSPILIQSMTNTNPQDIHATTSQIIQLSDAGCDLVRIAISSVKVAQSLGKIKAGLISQGCNVPVCADVHFNHRIAEIAAGYAEKVRINPGNFAEVVHSPQFKGVFSGFGDPIENIRNRLLPLLDICRGNKTTIRIGVNHGSLSERIYDKYGNTKEGMVESAMEYIRVCREEDFNSIVISLKSSDPKMMIETNRLLVKRMLEEGNYYPIHLGVTEAGEGEDGIIKSAVGIGTLLLENIGNTIRVSLSGNPVNEIPVARALVEVVSRINKRKKCTLEIHSESKGNQSKKTFQTPVVIGSDWIILTDNKKSEKVVFKDVKSGNIYLGISPKDIHSIENASISNSGNTCFIISVKEADYYLNTTFIQQISALFPSVPLIFKGLFDSKEPLESTVSLSVILGSLLLSNLGEGIWIEDDKGAIKSELSLDILQACKRRYSKTEIISCPTCGRTSFELESLTKEVKQKLGHLKGLTIGVMGCIVNGPGELGEADYGFIGSVPGKVNIYAKGKIIFRNIAVSQAVELLCQYLSIR